ncbi:MAG: M23 family metallopeptidase [Microbacteriaceae bacterium]
MLDLAFPFTGRWLTQNSPADRVPSHGTTRFASSYAIDFVPVDSEDRSAPFSLASLLRSEAPERFAGFGRPVLAPADGTVVSVHDVEPDHEAHRGFPSVGYALTQSRRADRGWQHLAGNHILIRIDGAILALCHLQRGSIRTQVGSEVHVGDEIGRCGNSGNSTEPHLHLQAIDRTDPDRADAVPFTLRGRLPRNGEIVVA